MNLTPPPLPQQRYHHVVKHLYRPAERWDLVDAALGASPAASARTAGCTRPNLDPRADWERVGLACREQVLLDHDRFLFPACVAAVRSALGSGLHARIDTDQGPRDAFVGADGVFVLLHPRPKDPPRRLATGYRHPPVGVAEPTNEHFFAVAVRKLRDKASLSAGGSR